MIVSTRIAAFVTFALAIGVKTCLSQCGKTHPYVGLSGPLTELEHDVSGTVTIIDDCSFKVESFTYDGTAPAVYWWGAEGPSQKELEAGMIVSDKQITEAANGEMVTIKLKDGVTWDDVKTISVWCETLAVNFGHLDLTEAKKTDEGSSKCGKIHPFVGRSGKLAELEHDVAGTVTIIDDCTFKVESFTYDGAAPAVFWWGAEGPSQKELEAGMMLNDKQLKEAANGEMVTIKLKDGVTWDDVKTISVWCESLAVNMGHIDLTTANTTDAGSSKCGKTHPFVGRSGPLAELEHDVAGTVTIIDDCTFKVESFTYDGAAPAVYWWGAKGPSQKELEAGMMVTDEQIKEAANGEMVTIKLKDGVTWDDVKTISVWCESLAVNMGHIDLTTANMTDAGSSKCGKTHPFVGRSGQLAELEHDVAGTVTIIDDCTFKVESFTYDGAAPTVFWWGAEGPSQKELEEGRKLTDKQIKEAANGETVTIKLKDGVTWDDVKTISVWCESLAVNMGHIDLMTANMTDAGPSDKDVELPKYCREIVPEHFNLYWELKGGNVTVGFEGYVDDFFWLGFGFTDPSATDVQMTGSDVVIVGSVDEECFALDYFLEGRVQCDQGTKMSGVCSDAEFAGNSRSNNVVLESCEWDNGILRVVATRPLSDSDEWDNNWPRDNNRPAVWAMGPLAQESTPENPIVLFHQGSLPEGDGSVQLFASPGFEHRMGSTQKSCTPLNRGDEVVDIEKNVTKIPPEVLGPEVTVFNVSIGLNPNYPNPPGWGISYHINGYETPVLTVVRGETYTFNVMAGDRHPFYITTSELGAGTDSTSRSDPDQKIFAGGESSFGSEEQPFELIWTVQEDVPDLLYYQCWTHLKLGWQVNVINQDDLDTLSLGISG